MRLPSAYALTASLAFATLAVADSYDSDLVGTWSTKSNKTLTGPGFYNPVADEFIEPSRTGISYSFTSDGYYEEAYYRAIANPQNPACPSGIMQWQHGTYTIDNGSLLLTPFAVDGRQLLSSPCEYDNSIYTRYNQSETFKSYEVLTDAYHNIQRLNLFEFDGSPMNPMYLVYSPPEMLPTSTLNPTTSATAGATSTSSSKKRNMKRDGREVPLNFKMQKKGMDTMNPDRWWWIGLTLTGVGGLLYFGPRRMGLSI
ncbi:Reversal of tor2 lethality [Zalaria obscura]|uniref:Reversal of tor2 lethality n=1 Tax=Zalaria obscura TaxID=2024903 RepID=A0ACC3SER3_9PEZI